MNSNDLVLSINGTTDSLTIANYFAVNSVYMGTDPVTGMPIYQDERANTVEEVRFADGTVWTQAQLDIINGTAGDDILQGSTGNDLINGLAGNDLLIGNAGNDTLDGGAGNDGLVGDIGNDTYLFDIGGGQDVIYDYDWTNSSLDVVQFGAGVLPANVTAARSTMNSNDLVLSINGTTDSLTIANYFAVNSTYMGTDPVTGMPIYQDERANTVEEVRFADGTTWTMAQMDAIFGIINGTVGDDLLQGGTGNDVIKGLAGNDTLDGDAGNDVLNGGSGNDLLNGGLGDDILDGGAGNDLLIGGEGNNIYLFGTGSGQDTIDYSATNSLSLVQMGVMATDVTASRAVNSQNDLVLTINGTTDCLTIKGYFTNSGTQIQFGDGSTWLNSDVLRDLPVLLDGTDGADNIVAPNIGYWPLGGSFVPTNAIINGNTGNDTLTGADGNDILNGGDGNDTLNGGAGNNMLNGGAGDDTLHGSTGNDVLDGGAGNDLLAGGGGYDTFLFGVGSGQDIVYSLGVSLQNTIQIDAGMLPTDVTVSRRVNDPHSLILTINGTTDSLTLSGFFDQSSTAIQFADGTRWDLNTFRDLPILRTGTDGSDVIGAPNLDYYDASGNWHAVDAIVNGFAGDDYVYGAWGNDTIDGGSGNDTVLGGFGNDTLNGGAGNDRLIGDYGNDTYLFGLGGGEDTIALDVASNNAGDVVQFGSGIAVTDITAIHSATNSDDLVLSINGTTDSLTIEGYFSSPVAGIRFADGTVLDSAAITQMTNSPPVAASDSVTVNEDGTAVISQAQLLANDADPDAGILSINGFDPVSALGNTVTQDASGNFVIGIGNNYQSLGAGQTATDSFTYTIIDAFGATSTATVNVTITGSNDGPVVAASIASQQTSEDAAFSFTVPAGTFTDIDNGDVLTYTATLADGTALPSWLTFEAAMQTFSGTPANGDVGNYSITVTATDTGGLSASNTFAVAVANVNDAPTVSMALVNQATLEDAAFSFTVPAGTFADVDFIHGDSLAYSVTLADGTALPSWLTFDAVTQTFSGTPGNGDVGNLNVRVTATDMAGASVSATFALDVQNVNDAPVAADDAVATNEDVTAQISVAGLLANDHDIDVGDTLSITGFDAVSANGDAVTQDAMGNLVVNIGNRYQALASGQTATDNFSYTVTDAAGATSTATVTVTINGVNDGPLAQDDNVSLSEDAALAATGNVLSNDSDVDQSTVLTVANAGTLQGNYGSLVLNADGTYSYALDNALVQSLAAGQSVTETFSYQTTDGIASMPATLTVTIDGSNDAAVSTADTAAVQEDLSIAATGNVLANDSDVDQGTVLQVSQAGVFSGLYGQLTLAADGSYTYALYNDSLAVQSLAQGQTVTEAFAYEATDGVVGTASTITFTITGNNDAPVVAGSVAAQQANEDSAFVFTVPAASFADLDQGDVLTYSATLANGGALPSWLLFDAATQTFSGVPGNLDVGNYSVTVTATDTNGLSASSTFAVDVANVNDAPTVSMALADRTALEDAAFSFTVPAGTFADVDFIHGDSLTYAVTLADGTALPAWLSFDAATQTLSGIPANGDVGNINVRVTATDIAGASASSTFALNVQNVNDAPVIAASIAAQQTNEDAPFSFTVPAGSFTDVDQGDVLTYSATLANGGALPSWLVFDAATQTFSGTPANGDVGSYNVTVTASDAAGLSASSTFAINVANVNDAPVISAALVAQNVTQGQAFSYALSADSFTDADQGDVLTYSATLADGSALPAWLSFDAATLTFSGTPGAGSVADLSIVVTATDTGGLSANSSFALAVSAPVFNGTSGGDVLTGTVYDDTMHGLAGNDTLNGGAGNDTLDGGTGSDTLKGGLGNDTYVVDSTGDSVSENSGEGTDTVQSSITYTLGSNVENLTLTGTNAINGTGNSMNNVLDGSLNTAANILTGGSGNDTYILGAGDTIVEQSSAGTDTVMISASYTLGSNIENLTLTGTATVNATGNSLNNILIGNSADNVLNGRSGSDTMIGGAGDDTYVVGSSGDVVTENANEGTDLVQSSVSHTLAGNVENLTLTGSNNINGTGNSLDNILVGNSVRNTLAGGAGNDLLNGGLGNDTLNGDAGNDILRGGDGDNILSDTAGANVLDGGAGIDTLTGNSGNEMFVGGTGSDIINTGAGADILAFNLGDGMDVVNGGIGTDNTISLGGGIGYADIALSKVNNDLILEVGNGDQITLANWYDTAANYKSVIDLQVMADAMAGFDPASGDPLMNRAVQNFDFTAIVNAFDQAHGGSATYMHWSATSELLAAHLSGSDTMALGGDLAHQYGSNSSFSGMNLTSAQVALNDPQFGGQAQLLSPLQGLQGGAVTL
jgi:VCBS repeat-containing protein